LGQFFATALKNFGKNSQKALRKSAFNFAL